jgi:hypothetical protein
MTSPLHASFTGSFVSTGQSTILPFESSVDYFELFNETQMNSAANPGVVKKASWIRGMAAGSAYVVKNTNGLATDESSLLATGGVTLINTSVTTPGPVVALTAGPGAVTQAAPALAATGTTTGLVDGVSVVRMINTVGMFQIAGMDFTVGAVVAATSFQLKFLDSSGFAAGATDGSYRILPFDPIYYPRSRFITKITQAAQAVVTMSVNHGYTVGQLVRINVPSAFGMIEMNGLQGTVLAVDLVNNTITLNIDSTAFSAFAFPTSAIAANGVSFPQVVPIGEAATAPFQNSLDDATRNTAVQGVQLGTGVVGVTSDVIRWFASKGIPS